MGWDIALLDYGCQLTSYSECALGARRNDPCSLTPRVRFKAIRSAALLWLPPVVQEVSDLVGA